MSEPAAFDARAAFFRENLTSASFGPETREALEAAEPAGVVLTLPDGDSAMAHDGRVFGAATDLRSETDILALIGRHYDGVVVIFGFGFGHLVRALRERTSAPIVVFEPHVGMLRAVLEHGPWDLPDVHVVTSPAELERLWSRVTGARPHARLLATPGYPQAFEAAYEEVTASIRRVVSDVELVENTRSMRYREWISHIMENVERISEHPLVMGMGDALKGVPAFVVSAGPSLDKNIELLREASQKGIVICVEVSGRAIAKRDLPPAHIVVSLEGHNLSTELEISSASGDTLRAISLSANPASVGAGKGALMPFFEFLPGFRGLTELTGFQGITVGGSVSTAAFSIALQLGCSPIVVMGQDLAFTGGRTHAGGTLFDNTRVDVSKETGMLQFKSTMADESVVDGSYGGGGMAADMLFETVAWGGEGTVATNSTWNSYRLWFEIGADTVQRSGLPIRLVNCTEGGARIHGFEELTLRQLLDTLPDNRVTTARLVELAREKGIVSRSAIRKWASDNASRCHRIKRSAFLLENTQNRPATRWLATSPSRSSAPSSASTAPNARCARRRDDSPCSTPGPTAS